MDFGTLAQECAPAVAPQTLAAIVKTESRFNPFAINVNGPMVLTRQPRTKAEAVKAAKWLLAKGYNVDLGLGQINSANLERVGLSVQDAFDPCQNIAASAAILQMNYRMAKKRTPDAQKALRAAISAYNTGSFVKGYQNGYVYKVVSNATATTTTVPAIDTKSNGPIKLKASEPPKNLAKPAPRKAPPKELVYGGARDDTPTNSVMVYQ